MKLENQLSQLQSVKPSNKLRKKLYGMVENLPDRRGFYFPLTSFQMGIALAALLVIVGVGAGVIAGVKESRPGTILYPVKEFIQKKVEDKGDLQQQVAPSVVPTRTVKQLILATPTAQLTPSDPTPSISPTIPPKGEDSHGNQNISGQNRRSDFSEEAKSKVEKFFEKFLHHDNTSLDDQHEK